MSAEFVNLMMLALACAALGFVCGWIGGKAQGRDDERSRQLYELGGGDAARDSMLKRAKERRNAASGKQHKAEGA